jgi:hypothetical protein
MVDTFTDLVERWSNSDMKAERAAAFFGVLVGVLADTHQEAATLCCRMPLLDDPNSPDDILPVIATDRMLERYYLETADQHRGRLFDAWEIYKGGGSAEVIETQLRAAGFGPTTLLGEWGNPDVEWGEDIYFWGDLGAFVQFRPWELGPRGEAAPYWSQFWVVFGVGMHPVSGPPTPWGDFVWGDIGEWVWRPAGYTQDFARTILAIVKKWKDSRYVFRGFRFMLNDIPWGDTSIEWGDETVIFGGAIDVPVPLS